MKLTELIACFTYNPRTGELRHNSDRPQSTFLNYSGYRIWQGKFAGKVAGSSQGNGKYIVVRVRLKGENKQILAHRIAYAIGNCVDLPPPSMQVDHINGKTQDNSISNLRLVSHGDNARNANHKIGKTGFRGVVKTAEGRFQAKIHKDGIHKCLGTFETPSEAHMAYLAAAVDTGRTSRHTQAHYAAQIIGGLDL